MHTAADVVSPQLGFVQAVAAAAPRVQRQLLEFLGVDPQRPVAPFAAQPANFILPLPRRVHWSGAIHGIIPTDAAHLKAPSRGDCGEPAGQTDRHRQEAVACFDVLTNAIVSPRQMLDEAHHERHRSVGRKRSEAVGTGGGSLGGKRAQPLDLVGAAVAILLAAILTSAADCFTGLLIRGDAPIGLDHLFLCQSFGRNCSSRAGSVAAGMRAKAYPASIPWADRHKVQWRTAREATMTPVWRTVPATIACAGALTIIVLIVLGAW